MKTEFEFTFRTLYHSCRVLCAVAFVLQAGMFAGNAQPGVYLYNGSKTTITLNSGTYVITAYGAQGGAAGQPSWGVGGLGAEMSGEFSFSGLTTLTLLVGGGGGTGYCGGGGGGASFVVEGSTPLVIAGGGGGGGAGYSGSAGSGLAGMSGCDGYGSAPGAGGTGGTGGGAGCADGGGGFLSAGGWSSTCPYPPDQSFLGGGAGGAGYGYYGNGGYGCGGGGGAWGGGGGGGYSGGGGGGWAGGLNGGGGGGSIIDSSAIMVLAEVSGIASPNGSPNGEIIIIAVPEPSTLALAGLGGLCFLLFSCRRK